MEFFRKFVLCVFDGHCWIGGLLVDLNRFCEIVFVDVI